MRKSIKNTVTTGVVAAALILGGAGVATATTGAFLPGATSNPTSSGSGTDSNEQETPIVGTVTAQPEVSDATEGAEGSENKADETAQDAAEIKALESLATITSDEATAAALQVVPGTAGQVQLDEKDGFVVYEVEITAQDGTVTKVVVDAGNATVLAQETEISNEGNEASNANDVPDTNEALTPPTK